VTEKQAWKGRRWPKVLLAILGALALAAGGLVVALRLTSPPPLDDAWSARPLPEAWAEADALPSNASDLDSPESPAGTHDSAPASLFLEGHLSLYGRGRSFGVEHYEIRGNGESVVLSSTGEFRFRALVATIRVGFEQRLETGGDFTPRSYDALFDAPLGLGRVVHSEIADGVARTSSSGNDQTVSEVGADVVVLGTFGTYALLPLLFSQRQQEGSARFDVLILGGPPSHEETVEATAPRVTLDRASPVEIVADGRRIRVDAYIVSSPLGESLLLAKELEFLALLAADEGETLAVIRSDFFPNGFEIVDVESLDLDGPLPSAVP